MLIVGGGIGGLGAALACARAGWQIDLLEQADAFGEFGAGIQLGPNVVRVLHGWGLAGALEQVAARPGQIEVRDAHSGRQLALLPLGAAMQQRYGAPYLTIARADLHSALLGAVQAQAQVAVHLDARVMDATQDDEQVRVQTVRDQRFEAPLLVAADGVWSKLRALVVRDEAPRITGHLAYRAMAQQSALPAALRCTGVTVWLGPEFHVVQYPVRGGDWLNAVAVIEGQVSGNPRHWDHSANATELSRHMLRSAAPLRELLQAMPSWRLWPLSDRAPMQSAADQARGRVALLGDAAHPMVPYLAQGAGMAIEDAQVLAQCLQGDPGHPPAALRKYAQLRWRRNARVQARATRNGEIFHLRGVQRTGRDLALRLLGARLLDMPWLYGGPVA